MRTKTMLVALVSFLLFSFQVSAQKKVFSGFYLTPKGEKVEGTFANYQQWDMNPSEVAFVPSTSAGAIALTPSNCRMFLVNSYDEYLAYSGKRLANMIGDAQTVMNKGSESADDQSQDLNTFLRLVTREEACELYIFKDEIRTNFFIKLPGKPLTELRYKEYYSQGQIKEFPEYKQQLQASFSGVIAQKKLQGVLTDLPYSEEAMLGFFNRLFPAAKKTTEPNKEYDGWVVSAGLALSFLKTEGGSTAIVETRQTYSPSVAPLVSIGYMLTSKRAFGKYFFYPQVKAFRYQHSVETIDNGMRTTIAFHSSLTLLPELNAGANIVNKENLRFHLSVGAGLMSFFKNEHVRNRYDINSGELYFTSQDDLYKTCMAANITAGMMLNNKLLLTASYQLPTTIGELVYYSAIYSGVLVRVGYKLH